MFFWLQISIHQSLKSLVTPSVISCGETLRWPLCSHLNVCLCQKIRCTFTHAHLFFFALVDTHSYRSTYLWRRVQGELECVSFPAGGLLWGACRIHLKCQPPSAFPGHRCSPWVMDIHRSGRRKEERIAVNMCYIIRRCLYDDGG